jgi:hypothetical protein
MPDDFLTPFLTRIGEKHPAVSTDDLSALQIAANLKQALREYSRHAPLTKVKDYVADGDYDFTLPTDWVQEFSAFLNIEYPADVSQDPSDNVVAPEEYGVYQKTTEYVLRFFKDTPGSGTIRATYTIPHTVVTAASTVYANDFDAVCALAAGFDCFDLARRYAQDNDSFIAADAVDRKSKSEKYLSLGKSLVNEFAVHFNLNKEAEVAAASSNKNYDITYPGKIDQLTHPAEDR